VGQAGTAMAFDHGRGKTVHFGGVMQGYPTNETWEWDGFAWAKRTASTVPPVRAYASMAYDGDDGVTLLFGGSGLSDFWSWNGTNWTSLAGGPPARSYPGLAYDSNRHRLVLFGGMIGASTYYNDTWEWDPLNGWQQKTPTTSPLPRAKHRLVYDVGRRTTMLYGGQPTTDTWEWDGTTWRMLPTSDPEGDGSPDCFGQAMAYDSTRQKVVIFGGSCISSHNGTWEWNGASWREMVPADAEGDVSPVASMDMVMVYDDIRQRIVLSGASAGTDSNWELDAGISGGPGQVMSVPLSSANLPTGSTILSVDPLFVSGGHGGGSPGVDGVALVGWSRDKGWRQLTTNTSGVAAPGNIEIPISDSPTIQNLTFQNGFTFGVVPVGANGSGHAQVATDYVQVTVRYALP
jgi:hypothetical protein